MKRKTKVLICLLSGFLFYTMVTMAFAQNYDEKTVQEVKKALDSPHGDTRELLVKIGRPAVPIILDILQGKILPEELEFPVEMVEALGFIGDKQAVPVLLAILNDPKMELYDYAIKGALGRLGDSSAESALLDDFNQTNNVHKLEAAISLIELGTPTAIQKAKEFLEEVIEINRKYFCTPSVTERDAIWKQYQGNPFVADNQDGLPAMLFTGAVLKLRDEALLTKAIRYRQIFGGVGKEYPFPQAVTILTEIGTPSAIETLLKIAERHPDMQPPLLEVKEGQWETEASRKEMEKQQSLPQLLQVPAALALLNLGSKVPQDRLNSILNNLSSEGYIIKADSLIHPSAWNLKWHKWVRENKNNKLVDRLCRKISILCIIGNLEGNNSVEDILPETIKLNGKVSPMPWKDGIFSFIFDPAKNNKPHWKDTCFIGWHEHCKSLKGFSGPVMLVRFNKYDAIENLIEKKPNKNYNISIAGKLKNGKIFVSTAKIKLIGKEKEEKPKHALCDWLDSDNDSANWWNKDEEFQNDWRETGR